jgi:hypothetical protein
MDDRNSPQSNGYFGPRRLIAGLAALHGLAALPFVFSTRPAPLFEVWGDTYQGWPYPFQLNQGDAGPAYFSFTALAYDIGLAIVCTAPVSVLLVGIWYWHRTNKGVSELESRR